jgi:heat-inducible transcriptional repressor
MSLSDSLPESTVGLTGRQEHILRATIRHYVATAEPVGSKTLARDYNLSVSSATIRSSMSTLERAGLLYQPHTSAGRIPSDSGYRVYVDRLLDPNDHYSHAITQTLIDRLDWNGSIEATLRHAAQILSRLSGCITLITLPQPDGARLRHLQLVRVDEQKVMAIVVTDAYETQSVLFALPEDGSAAVSGKQRTQRNEQLDHELTILSNFLNSHLRDRLVAELTQLDSQELGREFQKYTDGIASMLTELVQRFATVTHSHLTVSGLSQVLGQPEFSETMQVLPLMNLIEEQPERLFPFVFDPAPGMDATPKPRVTIRIGAENSLEPMQSCALVSACYQRRDRPVGSVSVLGPTRMLYEHAIATVETAAAYLSQTLTASAI